MTSNDARKYRRIVVKAGTSLLTGNTDRLNLEIIASLVGQLARLHAQGAEVMLVSSGAVAAGRHVLGIPRGGKNLPLRQVLAAVGQGHLVHTYEQLFGWHAIPVAQALLSRRDLSDRMGYLNVRNTLLGLLEHRVMPIINENDVVAVDELAVDLFGENDSLSAMVANLVDADLLVVLGEVQGLFTSDPHLDPNAQLIPVVECLNEDIESLGGPPINKLGRGGMTTKIEAAKLATASGVGVVIASGLERDVLVRLADGESIGTFFPPNSSRLESRKRWMLSGLSTRGEICIDDGAVEALRHNSSSLLPAGVTSVEGSFERGDIIAIISPSHVQVACGITNYNSVDLARIKGMRSNRIWDVLGHQYGAEVVHRNNMVIL